MQHRRINGRKNGHGTDRPHLVLTEGWEIPTNKDVLLMIDAICENEEEIYPTQLGLSGCGMFLEEVNAVLNKYGYEVKEHQ